MEISATAKKLAVSAVRLAATAKLGALAGGIFFAGGAVAAGPLAAAAIRNPELAWRAGEVGLHLASHAAGELFASAVEVFRPGHNSDLEKSMRSAALNAFSRLNADAPPGFDDWFDHWISFLTLRSPEEIFAPIRDFMLTDLYEDDGQFRAFWWTTMAETLAYWHAAEGQTLITLHLTDRPERLPEPLRDFLQHRLLEMLQETHLEVLREQNFQRSWIAFQQQVYGGTLRRLSAIKQQLEAVYTPLLDPAFASVQGPVDFTYRARLTPFVGREAALEALRQFLADPRCGLWTVISGPAGSGKNRLAAELIEAIGGPEPAARKWHAGFLRNSKTWLKNNAAKWNRNDDTLLVIDYAGELDREDLADFLAHLKSTTPTHGGRIRVILLDRLPPESDLGVATRLTGGSDRRGEISENWWRCGGPDALALTPVLEERALEIARDRAGGRWTPQARARVKIGIQEDSELARPLFALLIGDAILSEELPTGLLNPVTVARHALSRIFRHAEGEYLEEAKLLWVVATMCQGVEEDKLFSPVALHALTGQQWPSASTVRLLGCVRSLSLSSASQRQPDQSPRRILPLEPDFLGSLFVLQTLLSLPTEFMLQTAHSLAVFAWRHGTSPNAFAQRVTSDFIGRASQVAEALQSSEDRVTRLIVSLVLSGMSPEGLMRGATRSVGYCAYLASRSGRPLIGMEFVQALESAYARDAERFASALANAWLAVALSGDLPATADYLVPQALQRITDLYRDHNTPELALTLARALKNAVAREKDQIKQQELGERIWSLRMGHYSVDIALQRATGLYYAAFDQKDPAKLEVLASRIRDIRKTFNTKEIALLEARALYNLIAMEQLAGKRRELAARIGEIRKEHNTAEIALFEARALSSATVPKQNPADREVLANQIGEIRKEHNSVEIAKQEAVAIFNASIGRDDLKGLSELASRIDLVRTEYNIVEIAEAQASILASMSVHTKNAESSAELADRIDKIWRDHHTAEIATSLAVALLNATVNERDLSKCEERAERIGQIRREYNTDRIAKFQAQALLNATCISEVS